jgi:hypothetical protein
VTGAPVSATRPGPALSAQDHADVIATCIRFAWCLDDRRWEDLGAMFGPAVKVDYTELFGGSAATLAPGDLVSASRRLLETLDRTQHLVASHLVSGHADRASCRSHVIATHTYGAARLGDRNWTVGGSYTMDLTRGGSAWLIVGISFSLAWSSGNHEIVRQSRSDAAASATP